MAALHYTNDLCPFAHRAMFARALCPVKNIETVHIPYKRQVDFAFKFDNNTWPGSTDLGQQMLREKRNNVYQGLNANDLKARKDKYVANVNPAGEVPSLQLSNGGILVESDVVMEYFATAGDNTKYKLIPADPELLCRMRLAIKRFNDVTGPLFMLLKNQNKKMDKKIKEIIYNKMEAFINSIDKESSFCFGNQVTLADVHCGPILYRMQIALDYYRHFHIRNINPRVGAILDAVISLPEWQSGLVSDEEIIANYELPSNGMIYAEDGETFAGRGRDEVIISSLL